MNILSEEMANLKEFRLKTSISILYIDEAMVDSSYHKTYKWIPIFASPIKQQ